MFQEGLRDGGWVVRAKKFSWGNLASVVSVANEVPKVRNRFRRNFHRSQKRPKVKKSRHFIGKGASCRFFSVTNKQMSKVSNKTTTTAVTVLFKVSAALYFLFKRGSRIERQVCFKHKQLQLKQNGGSNKSFERF